MPQPNILVITADQHAPSVLGSRGHPCVKTPSLDALAVTGVNFTSAYCPYPMCTPSRACFMTGLMAPQHNVWDLGSPLSSGIPTWAHALRSAGYQTTISGHMHFIGDDQLHGFERRLVEGLHVGVGPYSYDPWLKPITDDHVMLSAVQSAGPTANPTRNEVYDKRVVDSGLDELTRLQSTGSSDPRPWALCLGLIQPHAPYKISQPWWDLYDGVDIPLPPAPPTGDWEQHIPQQMQGSRRWLGISSDGATDQQVKNARRAYYAMVTQLDALVGQLIQRLKDLGQFDNTIILFTSDHGDNHGHHGLWSKLNFFQESVGIPLILSTPATRAAFAGATPRQCSAHVSLIDWLPTLLDLTGQSWPIPLPGQSLLPLLQDPSQTWPQRHILSDYAVGGTRVPIRMVRQGPFKACFAPPLPPVLFNLQTDPSEWHNLASDPAHQQTLEALEALARADGWNPATLTPWLQQEKRTLEYLRTVDADTKARTHNPPR